MELRERFGALRLSMHKQFISTVSEMARSETHQVCVPHTNSVLDTDLTHEEAIHPPKGKLHEFNAFVLQVRRERH